MSTSTPLAAVVLSSLLLGAACSKAGSTPEPEVASAPPPQTTTTVIAEPAPPPMPAEPIAEAQPPQPEVPAPAPLTDAQIAMILATVDGAEIEQAKLAQKKSKNAGIKKFAAHMIEAHTKAKQKGTTLTKKAKLQPEASEVSTELTGKTSATLTSLKTAEPASFDALYISAQAAQHEEVLSLVDSRLLPSATGEELKSFLGETRTMVESHVTEAKTLQQTLAAEPSTGAAAAPSATPKSP
jgi:putative membrane protein